MMLPAIKQIKAGTRPSRKILIKAIYMIFEYTIKTKGSIKVITLKGELMEKSQALDLLNEVEECLSGKFNNFILNLEHLKYLNSSGLGVLISILTRCRRLEGEVVVTNLSQKVKELFLITKLNSVFTVTENMEAAIASFKKI